MADLFFKSISTEQLIALSALDAYTPHTWLKVRKNFSFLSDFLKAQDEKLNVLGFSDTQVKQRNSLTKKSDSQMKLMEKLSIKLVKLGDKEYPELLSQINDPPLWLFWRGSGEVFHKPTLTIVGSRKVSQYAREGLEKILPNNLVKQLTLISGLAYGVDKLAHLRSLEGESITVAVLAGGLDSIYPVEHHQLAQKIVERGGALISEYPPLVRPRPYRFPVRNRILAGLSKATLIIQATLKSGTLTTARSALDYNRDLLVLAAPFNDQRFKGNNFLIKHGAQLVDESADIFEYFNFKSDSSTSSIIDKNHRQIIDFLDDGPLSVDQLCRLCDRPIEQVLNIIAQLEIEGHISQNELGEYQKKK